MVKYITYSTSLLWNIRQALKILRQEKKNLLRKQTFVKSQPSPKGTLLVGTRQIALYGSCGLAIASACSRRPCLVSLGAWAMAAGGWGPEGNVTWQCSGSGSWGAQQSHRSNAITLYSGQVTLCTLYSYCVLQWTWTGDPETWRPKRLFSSAKEAQQAPYLSSQTVFMFRGDISWPFPPMLRVHVVGEVELYFQKDCQHNLESPATNNRTVCWAPCRLCIHRKPPFQGIRKWCLPAKSWSRMTAHWMVLIFPLHWNLHLSEPQSQELGSRSTNYSV